MLSDPYIPMRIIAFALSCGALRLVWQGGKSSKGKAMTRLVVLGVRGDGALVDHGRKEAFVDVRCTRYTERHGDGGAEHTASRLRACAEMAHRWRQRQLRCTTAVRSICHSFRLPACGCANSVG